MAAISRVVLRTNEYRLAGDVDQVEVFMCDQWFRRDITHSRDIELAKRLAKDSGLELEDYRRSTPGHGA